MERPGGTGQNTQVNAAVKADVSPSTPVQIGRYVIDARLGQGGMADAWLGRMQGPEGFSRRVVIKMLKPTCLGPEYRSMFADEAWIGARLHHPCIPEILEYGDFDGTPYIVQEYVDGPSLVQLTRQIRLDGRVDLLLACRIASDVASALHHAYTLVDDTGAALRVIHRDVTPSNILLSRHGMTRLIDFGVARFAGRQSATEAGLLKGKVRYMAPEQILHGEVTHQGDLYSLGIVLYTLCTGTSPWDGGNDLAARMNTAPPPPSSRVAAIDAELDAIVLGCLESDPTLRFQTAGALELALRQWMKRNGGIPSNEEMAERVRALFPREDWRQADALPLRQTFSSVRIAPPPEEPSGPSLTFSLTVLSLMVAVLALTVIIPLSLYVIWRTSAY